MTMKQLGPGSGLPAVPEPGDREQYIRNLLRRIEQLEELLAVANDAGRAMGLKYQQLSSWYTKLADQWNAFQAVHRPTNRNVQRAEAVGEFGRRLIEKALSGDHEAKQELIRALISSAYPPDEFMLP